LRTPEAPIGPHQSIFRHELTILSRNPGHLEHLGVTVLDPFAKLPPTSA
jgi:hypothetical protein